MTTYIKHIVWRFAKHEPENFKLMDVRHNVMKSLILSDCNRLIKFILFGETVENEIVYNELRHIPVMQYGQEKSF